MCVFTISYSTWCTINIWLQEVGEWAVAKKLSCNVFHFLDRVAKWGNGRSFLFLHLCVSPFTPVPFFWFELFQDLSCKRKLFMESWNCQDTLDASQVGYTGWYYHIYFLTILFLKSKYLFIWNDDLQIHFKSWNKGKK